MATPEVAFSSTIVIIVVIILLTRALRVILAAGLSLLLPLSLDLLHLPFAEQLGVLDELVAEVGALVSED